ncbi:facilitated trehalose transporter Tret1-like [Planococcus citri]|uniref:facilitated trehalose transporter Tret1-like n=1 Tax=Planococcus citri TaxID=170843 RepID=UPI0031F7E366
MAKSPGTMNQILSIMTVALNELTIGIAHGWIAPTLNSLQSPRGEFNVTIEESSWLASLDDLGKIPGAVFAAVVLDIVGRKILLTSCSLVFFVIWVVIIFTRSVPVICSMRLLIGFFFGINDGTNSTYLAENSSPAIRGPFGALCITFYYIGVLVGSATATYFSYTTTSVINAAITLSALISVLWIKEPVQFLLMKGKITKAEKNFNWLHGNNTDSEFERIKQNVQSENLKKLSFKKTITSPANYKSLSIIVTINGLVGCVGYYPIMCYASIAFSATDMFTSNQLTVLFGVIQTLVVASTSLFIGHFNRRSLILISFSLIAFSHVVTSGLYYVNSYMVQIPYFPWLIFTSITFFASLYAFVYPAIFLIRGEMFPLSIKATGGCFSVIAYSATSFLGVKVFLNISQSYGIEVNFLIFFVFSLITIIFTYFFLPETKNKTLIEIQEMLERSK